MTGPLRTVGSLIVPAVILARHAPGVARTRVLSSDDGVMTADREDGLR